jgi:phospholipid/cholesterol/gamma-HCH transport system substrate-binding protein
MSRRRTPASHRLAGPVPRLGRLAIVAQALAALGFVALMLNAEGVRLPFTGGGDWTLRAQFTDAGGIHTGERTPVLVSGVPSGEVTNVSERGGVALVTMRLESSARTVIRADAKAAIEPRSALEDMTVDITPGSRAAPAARSGMVIPSAHTSPTTTLDQVVSVLDSDTRSQLAILIDQLARGIGGRQTAIAAAVDRLHSLLNPALQIADGLAERRSLLSSLVDSLAGIGTAAQSHDAALAQSLHSGAATLAVTARRQASVSSTIEALPNTLTSLNSALAGVRTLAQPLVPTLTTLRSTARALPAALSSVREVVPAAAGLLSAADAFVRDGAAGVHDAASVLSQLGPTASALTPVIADVEPIVSAVNDNRDGIGLLGARFSGVLSTNDANGPILRGLGSFEPVNPANFGFSSATGANKAAVAGEVVDALTQTCLRGGLVACLVRYLVPGLPK